MIEILFFIWIILSIPLHELGHYIIAKRAGVTIEKIVINKKGIALIMIYNTKEINKETIRVINSVKVSGFIFPVALAVILNLFIPHYIWFIAIIIELLYSIYEVVE